MYKLIAHRGSHSNFKENTIEAFKLAINEDYLGFECDVRQTKDDVFIIYHDPLYKGKIVKNLSLNEIDVPLLDDVLKIKTFKIIMLDIKDPFLDVKKFLGVINKYSNLNLYIMSFYRKVIEKLKMFKSFYKLGIINNFSDNYDFLCIYYPLLNEKMLHTFEKQKKLLFIYGIKKFKKVDTFPVFIVDENVNKYGN